MKCTFYRQESNYSVILTKSSKNLCLICYTFCYFHPPNKIETVQSESSLYKCQCQIHKNQELLDKIFKYLKSSKNIDSMNETIPIINQILNTKYEYKYLIEYDPQNQTFLNNFESDFKLIQKKIFKWHGINTDEIKNRGDFFSNIKKYWTFQNKNNPNNQFYPKYIDTNSIENLVPIAYIKKICRFTNKQIGTQTFTQAQHFYTKLLYFYKEVYLLKYLNELQPFEYEALERMNPISRIQIRKNNQKHFRKQYPIRQHQFNPVDFLIYICDQFLLEYNFRWVGDYHYAHLYVFQIAHLLFSYGVLTQVESTKIFEVLYQKITSVKSLQNAIINDYQIQKQNNFTDIQLKSFDGWGKVLTKIRQIFAQIVSFLLFHRQDTFVESIILKKKRLQMDNQIIKAFFQESTAKKLVDLIFTYFLNDVRIGNINLVSEKLIKITKDLLFISMKVHDSYLTGLNLIKQSQLQKYKYSLGKGIIEKFKNNKNTQNESSIKKLTRQLLQDYFINKVNFFNRPQLSKNLWSLFQKIESFIKNETDEKDQSELAMKGELEDLIDEEESNHDILEAQKLKKLNKYITYKCQKILFEDNIIGELITIYELFYQIMSKDLIQKFYQIFRLIFYNNGILSPMLLNSNILSLFFSREAKNTEKFQFINFIINCFDKQWICAVSYNLKEQIFKIFDIFSQSYLKNRKNYYLQQQLIKLIKFMANWQGDFQREKRFHKFMPTDTFRIIEVNLKLLKAIMNKSTFVDVMNLQKQGYSLINAILKRITSCIQGLYTNDIFQDARNFFTLEFFDSVLTKITDIRIRQNLVIIFENLYLNFKQNLITQRTKYGMKNNNTYIQNSFIQLDDYNRIIAIMIKLLLHSKSEIQSNQITEVDDYADYLYNAVCASNLRFVKYILNLRQQDTYLVAPYIISLRELLNTSVITSNAIQKFLKIQSFNLLQKVRFFSQKILKYDQITAENRQALMIANVIKKYFKYIASKKNSTVINRIHYFLFPSKMSKFKLNIISNSMQDRADSLDRLKVMIKQKNDSILYDLQIYYLEAKLRKLTYKDKNVYLNELMNINQSRNDQLSDSSIILKNFANFIVKFLDFTHQKKRNQTVNFIELFCNILFFVTKPIQDQLYQILKKDPQTIKDMWQQIIRSWNFITNKAVLNKHWKDETTKLIIILKFNQFLAEDNNLKWKNFFGEIQIRQNLTITELIYELQTYMVQQNSWNVNNEKYHLDEYNDRNRKYLFPVAFGIRQFINEIVIGPNYRNIGLLHQKGYRWMIQILKKYNRQLVDDPLSTYKNFIMEYILTILQGNHKFMYDELEKIFSIEFLQAVYCNCIKQLYYQITDSKNYAITKYVTQFKLNIKQLKKVLRLFKETEKFSSHPVIRACSKIYTFIQILSYEKSIALIFVNERNRQIEKYKQYKKTDLTQEELCCYWFLSQITIGIQIIRYYSQQEKQNRKNYELENNLQVTNIDRQVMVYYFKKPGSIIYLSNQSKRNFELNVDRDSGQSKNYAILQQSKRCWLQIKYNKSNFSKKFQLFSFIENIYYFQIVSYIIALILNLNYILESNQGDYNYGIIRKVAFALSLVQIALNSGFYIIYVVFRLPLDYQINKDSYKLQSVVKKLSQWEKFKILLETLIYNSSFALLLYLVFTVLSLTFRRFFIAFQLLLLINLNKTLGYVLRSITKYRYQLIFAYIFGLIIVYILTFIAYIKYASAFMVQTADGTGNSPQSQNQLIGYIDPNQQYCSGLLPCYMNVVNNALRSNNGIGQLQYPQSYFKSSNYWQSFLLSLTFFYLINVIMNNMIFGIIISTFGDLRDEQRKFQEDKKNRCFICNIQKNKFESEKLDFWQHQKIDHHKWNYVYFLYSLEKKTYKDCNALQHYLKRQVQKNSISWMPLNESKKLNACKQLRKSKNQIEQQENQQQTSRKFKKQAKQKLSIIFQNMMKKQLKK